MSLLTKSIDMNKRYFSALMVIMILSISCKNKETPIQKSPDYARWDFNDLNGWKYAQQDDHPSNQYEIKDGILKIWTRAESLDRKKFYTLDRIYTSGRYKWKTFISELGEGDQTSIGSWIYCNDEHELDFEVGYGKKTVRDELRAQSDDFVAYMTTQANPYKSVPVLIKGGWHIFEMDLSLKKGKYFVQWLIDGKVVNTVQQTFGTEYLFTIMCSVENLNFIGDTPASKDNYGLYDYIEYTYHE
jgi:hypothetical protein